MSNYKGAVKQLTTDAMVNEVTGLGTSRDKTTFNQYLPDYLGRGDLTNLYRFDGMARKIIDKPIFDTLRHWRVWLDESETMANEEAKLEISDKLFDAMRCADVYGGSVMVLVVKGQSLSKPLNMNTLGKDCLLRVLVVDLNLVSKQFPNMDIASEDFLKPEYYQIKTTGSTIQNVHPSRVIEFGGDEVPVSVKLQMGNNEYWDQSKYYRYKSTLDTYNTVHNAIEKMMVEANIDVISIPNLPDLESTQMGEAFERRMELMDLGKSVHKVMIKDENEKFERASLSVAGMAELLGVYQTKLSAVSQIPTTELFGTSAKGLNATGEGDKQSYYQLLEQRQAQLKNMLRPLDELLWLSATGTELADDRAGDAPYTWNDLEVRDNTVEADVMQKMSQAEATYIGLGILTPDEVRERIKGTKEYDIVGGAVEPPMVENEGAEDNDKKQDND